MNKLLRNMSVLIVDDVKAPRRVLRKLLSEIGITTVTEPLPRRRMVLRRLPQ